MILTGRRISDEIEAGRLVIEPFDPARLEPNSYGFHLGEELMYYDDAVLDASRPPRTRELRVPEAGMVLQPGRLYLGCTHERMGSMHYAATLYARRSASTAGLWIQHSAPLGHTGAIIHWTLEIQVAHPLIVYPRMPIGKIAFWQPEGVELVYRGKYRGAESVVPSRLADELTGPGAALTPAAWSR